MSSMRFLNDALVERVRESFGTPVYVYDQATLEQAAREVKAFPAPCSLVGRYAMKALPNRSVLRIFDEAGLIWGPVMGLHEVPQDPHAQELGMFPKISHPELGDYTTVNIPMRFANADVRPQGPSPQLGQHTQQVLENAGFSADDITGLRNQGIIE